MKSGLRTLSPQGLDPSPMPSLPDILAHTATCELEQEKMRFMAGAGATRGTGTRGEPGHRFLNPQDSAQYSFLVQMVKNPPAMQET